MRIARAAELGKARSAERSMLLAFWGCKLCVVRQARVDRPTSQCCMAMRAAPSSPGPLPRPACRTQDELKQFLHGLMMKTGALSSPGSAILSCKITPVRGHRPLHRPASCRTACLRCSRSGHACQGVTTVVGACCRRGGRVFAGCLAWWCAPLHACLGSRPRRNPLWLWVLCACVPQEKNYAFVEFRSVEETSNAMAFDGVAFHDTFLKVWGGASAGGGGACKGALGPGAVPADRGAKWCSASATLPHLCTCHQRPRDDTHGAAGQGQGWMAYSADVDACPSALGTHRPLSPPHTHTTTTT